MDLIMNKLVIHAKIMIDGISDTPKKDQLITIEDDKITSIVTSILCIRLVLAQIKNLP